jgi:hypothetical protein
LGYFVRDSSAKLEMILVNQSILPKTLSWKELNTAPVVVVDIFIPAIATVIVIILQKNLRIL